MDDDVKKIGAEINEVPILDSAENSDEVINKLNIELVIIAAHQHRLQKFNFGFLSEKVTS